MNCRVMADLRDEERRQDLADQASAIIDAEKERILVDLHKRNLRSGQYTDWAQAFVEYLQDDNEELYKLVLLVNSTDPDGAVGVREMIARHQDEWATKEAEENCGDR